PGDTLARVKHWNRIAIDASGLDHTPVRPGDTHVFGQNIGPGRASRAIAIVHIAIFDSMTAVLGGYRSYTGVTTPVGTSVDAAIAQAAHDTLAALYPSQAPTFAAGLTQDLASIPNVRGKTLGIELG